MVKKMMTPSSLFQRHNKLQKKLEYVEDPTYSVSINSHVCITCSKFDYSSMASYPSILICNCHQKLIFQGQHLTHSCEQHQYKENYVINKKRYHSLNAA